MRKRSHTAVCVHKMLQFTSSPNIYCRRILNMQRWGLWGLHPAFPLGILCLGGGQQRVTTSNWRRLNEENASLSPI